MEYDICHTTNVSNDLIHANPDSVVVVEIVPHQSLIYNYVCKHNF